MEIIKDLKKLTAKIVKSINGKEVVKEYKLNPKNTEMTVCGKEILCNKPIEVPLSIKKMLEQSPNPRQQIQKMLQQERIMKELDGYESEEEFFDVGDDAIDHKSSYEFQHDLHQELLEQQGNEFMPEEHESPLEGNDNEVVESDSVENKGDDNAKEADSK